MTKPITRWIQCGASGTAELKGASGQDSLWGTDSGARRRQEIDGNE